MAAETTDRIRLNVSPEELNVLLEVIDKIDELDGHLLSVFNKIKLMHFKYVEGMSTNVYKVRVRPKKIPMSLVDKLGFDLSAPENKLVLPDPKIDPNGFNEMFMNKMDARLKGGTNNDQSSTE